MLIRGCFALLCCVLASPAWAAKPTNDKVLHSAEAGTAVNGIELDVSGMSAVGLQITISATATVNVEVSADGSEAGYKPKRCTLTSDASTASSVTASSLYQCNVAGLAKLRARISANTGTVTVFGKATSAVFLGEGSQGSPPAITFPVNGVLDTFTGCVDNTTPPNSNWTTAVVFGASSGALECSDTAVSGVATSESAEGYYNVITTNANSEVYATIVNVANAIQGWVLGRLVQIGANTTDGYGVFWQDATSIITIYRIDNGATTALGADFSQAIAAGDKVGLSMVGAQICAWFWDASGAAAWVELGCRTDATHTAGGRIGLNVFQEIALDVGIWDDFGGGNR